MKQRVLALLLTSVMCVSMLAACSSKPAENKNTSSEATENGTTAEKDTTVELGTTENNTTVGQGTTENNTTAKPETPTENETTAKPETPTENETTAKPEIKVITIKEAIEIAKALPEGKFTTERYAIRAKVTKMIKAQFGNMTIADATGEINIFDTDSADGKLHYDQMDDKAFVGDEVLIHCTLQNFNGTPEIKHALLIEFKHAEVTYDPSQYADMTISAVRDAKEGTLAKVNGVVAAITYANGKVPSGVILVDGTSSIYIYDSNIAAQVQIGNTISVIGKKTYWILETEQSNADKYGYKGCCQMDSATLISNDKKVSSFNKSWIKETTIKEILENPVSNDITTLIYKVNALVKKVDGTGFTNYYFNDLDGVTGSYTYTQCNGSDFEWLDKFDGKICTVYLMVINAKSSASGCAYRFLPVEVIDEGYKYDTNNAPQHIVEYYGLGQFLPNYTGNPLAELITSVSSDLLGFKDAKLSYTSDNTKALKFTEKDGKVILECLATGTANVTITGSYNGKTYSKTIAISVEIENSDSHDYVDIAGAINANVGDKVTVKGIVGPSLVNKVGFYLIDDTGVIAVLTSAENMALLEIGQEVIISGDRDLKCTKPETCYGQICLSDADIVANNYGKHDYSTQSFKESTFADFYGLNVKESYSTQVYVLKATVLLEATAYYTNIKLTDGTDKITLYCSKADQYSWLKAYAGQEVTVEIAPCNWNDKKYYAGCVLAVRTADGKILNTLNFDAN